MEQLWVNEQIISVITPVKKCDGDGEGRGGGERVGRVGSYTANTSECSSCNQKKNPDTTISRLILYTQEGN